MISLEDNIRLIILLAVVFSFLYRIVKGFNKKNSVNNKIAPDKAKSCLDCKYAESFENSDSRMLLCTKKDVKVTNDYYCSFWEPK